MFDRRLTSMLSILAIAAAVAGCAAPAPTPSASPSLLPSSATAASLAPGVTPLAPPSPIESPSSTGCPAAPDVHGPWPFARLVSVDAHTDASIGADVVTFGFDAGIGPGGIPTAEVRPVEPPFIEGGSGEPVEIAGNAHVQLRLEGMVITDDAGAPVYAGPTALTPGLPVVEAVVQLEAFEGVIDWVIGLQNSTCTSLVTDVAGRRIELHFSHAVP